MSRLKIIVMSSDNSSRMVPGFFHQWQKYGFGGATILVCQKIIPKTIPEQWTLFRSLSDYPNVNWGAHLRSVLLKYTDVFTDGILLLMDDYWLCQQIDIRGFDDAWERMQKDRNIHKIDLSGDRLGFAHDDFDEDYVISRKDAEYLTSTQAAIWNRKFLLDCLDDGSWTPWQFELEGTKRVSGRNWTILGQKNPSIQYANVSLRGQK